LRDQKISDELKAEAAAKLARCASSVEQLLLAAHESGRVVIVTLARSPWVTDSCACFFPGIAGLINELQITVVYAQDEAAHPLSHAKLASMLPTERENYWTCLKAEAIHREVESFYTKYAGQTWKNVISIGDSNFERVGTMATTVRYAVELGIAEEEELSDFLSNLSRHEGARGVMEGTIRGHKHRLRTKTFKMLEQPSVDELTLQICMVRRWLHSMVHLDDGFDLLLTSLNDADQIHQIEDVLFRQKRDSGVDTELIPFPLLGG